MDGDTTSLKTDYSFLTTNNTQIVCRVFVHKIHYPIQFETLQRIPSINSF